MAMPKDAVDDILDQWSEERPELDTDPLGVVIRVLSLNRRFAREAADALEPLGLELYEYDVLSALRRQGAPYELAASGLASETELSTGAMTNRVDRLEQRGLVERRADEIDRRSVIVKLTRSGRRAIDDALSHRLDAAEDTLADLSKAERAKLAGLLRTVMLGGANA